MKDRLADWGSDTASDLPAAPSAPAARQGLEEAESALIALGYKPAEAARMISGAAREHGDDAASEALIRAALKSTVK